MNKTIILLITTLCVSGCASNHHLVFFTNTTIGVEIGSEPSNGSPAKFIIGYKRQEGVIDPLIPDYTFYKNSSDEGGVTKSSLDKLDEPVNGDTNIVMTPQGTAVPNGGVTRAHSVLAKMNFGATGGGSGASAAQFFATGRAAELLAESDGITAALAGDAKINSKRVVELGDRGIAYGAHIQSVYNFLVEYSGSTKDKAGEALVLKNKLDALDSGMFKKSFKQYTSGAGSLVISIDDSKIPPDKTFSNLFPFITSMTNSLSTAKDKVLNPKITHKGNPLSESERKEMLNSIETYPKSIEDAKKVISSSSEVASMIDFVYTNLLFQPVKN